MTTTERKHWIVYFLCILASIIATTAISRAADVSLEWDANTESDLLGYTLRGISSTDGVSDVRATIFAPGTQYTVTGLAAGATYTFTLTAFTVAGLESGPSNAVTYTVPVPIPPPLPSVLTHDADAKSLRWIDPVAPPPPQLATYVVQHAPPGGQWADAATVQGSDYTLPAGLAAGEHRYRVTKLVQGKPGEWSNTLTLTVPVPPQRLRIALQISTDLRNWKTVAEHDAVTFDADYHHATAADDPTTPSDPEDMTRLHWFESGKTTPTPDIGASQYQYPPALIESAVSVRTSTRRRAGGLIQ